MLSLPILRTLRRSLIAGSGEALVAQVQQALRSCRRLVAAVRRRAQVAYWVVAGVQAQVHLPAPLAPTQSQSHPGWWAQRRPRLQPWQPQRLRLPLRTRLPCCMVCCVRSRTRQPTSTRASRGWRRSCSCWVLSRPTQSTRAARSWGAGGRSWTATAAAAATAATAAGVEKTTHTSAGQHRRRQPRVRATLVAAAGCQPLVVAAAVRLQLLQQ